MASSGTFTAEDSRHIVPEHSIPHPQEIALMLPADVIAEIIANLAALNLQPNTAATVLGALAPLLRTAETPPPAALEPPPRSSRRPRASKRPRGAPRRRKYNRRVEARD